MVGRIWKKTIPPAPSLTTGPSWLKLHSAPQLQKLVLSALCTVRYMFTIFFRSKICPKNIFGRLTCCLNFYPSLSLWEDWKSPPNMIEQLLTERREVGCLLASGAECLHLPLPSPARHLSPIPTIHLSFILLKPSPPYKTNIPPPSVWLLFCSLLDFTLPIHNMSQIVSYLKK